MEEDEKYMWRCIQLARNGLCTASPNPMVGAVIVCDGKIIGEGYHIRSGKAHAEVNAVGSVKNQSLLRRSTIYVSLEPCSHYGKTPPCADMLIAKGIPRVVIGCEDPFVKVHGRGIQKLLDAGCEVKTGVLEKECRQLIRKFVTLNTLGRPYVTLKWAESADGFIGNNVSRTILSSSLSTLLVQKRRAENDAIMVGTETARIDDPRLTLHNWYGKNPIRVVLDRRLSLPRSIHLFDGYARTLVFTTLYHSDSSNVEYIVLPEEDYCLSRFLKELAQRDIQSLLVEGGARLHQSFIDEEFWDEAYVEKSVKVLGGGVHAAQLKNIRGLTNQRALGVDIFKYIH